MTRIHLTPAIVLAAAATVSALVLVAPAQAATIPAPPAVCNPTGPVGGHPVLASFARTPGSVDVTHTAHHVTFTVHATDSTHPITDIDVYLASPTIGSVQRYSSATLTRVAGTGKNGTWRGTAAIPRWTNPGTWKVTEVDLSDAGGGYTTYEPYGHGDRPWKAAWPKSLVVAATADRTAPSVTSVRLAKTSLDTRTGAAKLRITVHATDAASGVLSRIDAQAMVSFGSNAYSAGAELKRVHGDSRDGTYVGSLTVPRYVGAGTHRWRLSLDLIDHSDNDRSVRWWSLRQKHQPYSFLVISRTDASKPTLASLAISPGAIDARTADKKVSVSMQGADTGSGVSAEWVTFTSPSGYLTSTSYEGEQSTPDSHGRLSAKAVVPQCSEPGVWKLQVGIVDAAGNVTDYTSAQLKALGLPYQITVQALDVQAPFGHVHSTVPHAGPITVTFTEPTLWKGSTVPITVYDTTSYAAKAGTWVCSTTGGATVGCNANGANVVRAEFTPTTAFVSGRKYEVLASRGIYDTAGNGPTLLDGYVRPA